MNNVDAALELLLQLSSSFHATKRQLSSQQLQTFGELKSLEITLQLLGQRLSDDNTLLLQLNAILGIKIDLGPDCSFTADEQRVIAAVIEELKEQLILGAQQSQNSPNPTVGQNIIANDNYFGNVAGSVLSHNRITLNADPAVREGVDKLVERTTDAQNRTFGDWISTLDFKRIQQDTLSKQASGTCSWFIEEASFQSWVNGEIKFLWCPGNPGVGKTILASSIIDYLQCFVVRANIGVVYLYCDYTQRTNQTTTELLGSILKQLLLQPPDLLFLTSSARWKPNSLCISLSISSSMPRRMFGHECNQRNLYGCTSIAARNSSSFGDLPQHLFLGKPKIEVRAREDFRTYIKGRILSKSRIARLLKGDADLQEEIISQVVSKAAGMFLLAQLHVDSLASKHSRKALRASLQTLPKEINNSYDETMRRIKAQGERLMRELQYALAISPEMTEMEEDAIVDVELLTAVCAGLVVVEEVSTVVRLVHYTTQQYFERQQESLFPNPHSSIAITCIQYLRFDVHSRYYSSFQTPLTVLD
ncbi:hypothetical protein C8J56DRAFT_1060264 [Mycena floridula]|nr:hypothetical protein C8J56DRAFT_1060264 [Mycena floridula]